MKFALVLGVGLVFILLEVVQIKITLLFTGHGKTCRRKIEISETGMFKVWYNGISLHQDVDFIRLARS